MGYRYKYEDGSILEFSQEPTLREIEQAGINAGIVKPTLKQKFDETLMGGFQSIAKMGTGILRSGVALTAALSPTQTLSDFEAQTKKPGTLNSIAAPFVPGSQAAKDYNAQYITPKNPYQQRGQLAGDIGQFLLQAPVTGVSNLQRLAIAPLIDTALQVTQDVGGGTTDQKTLLTNAMLTAGTSIMAGVFMPTKNPNWMKMSASGALTGYVADVATGLTGARGEDRTGLNSLIPGGGTAFGTAMGVGTGALTRFSPAGKRAKVVENRIKVLTQLEADHPKIRAAFDNAREQGYDPMNILAYTDALNDSTTRGGKIDMGNAFNRLNTEMEPIKSHIYKTLKEEGTTITVKQYAKGLTDILQSSRLQMDERVALQKKIAKLIEVGKVVAKENGGVIPLYKLQARKTSLGSQIRTQYGTVKGSTNKEIVRAYKEIIEKYTTSMDVKAYNQLLQQLYTFSSVLKSLHGRVIEGGRLGRHVQTLLGTYIGGHVGGAPGAVLGAEIGYKATGVRNKNYFKRSDVPFIENAYEKSIAQSRNIRGNQNQVQSKNTTQANTVMDGSLPQKKGLVTKAKDAVKGAIKAYKDLPPATKQGGFAKISGEGESSRAKAEQTIKGRQVSSGNDSTLAAFAASKNHEPVAELYGKKFEIGDFGKSAGERKKTKQDRFDFSKVPGVLKDAFLVARSGSNKGSYRYGNKVFIAKQGDGFAAVYTRTNARGNEEIINWHAIPAENMAKYLDDIGIPSRNRTDMTSLEGSQFVHLAYGDNLTIPQQLAKINESVVVNERFQIIDPSKTGEDAVLGMTSDLSKELASQVIRAKKSGDMATLESLYPKISAEMDARLIKKNAMDKALTSMSRSEANSTTRVRMPISEKFQEGTEKAFRLLQDGRTAEADARFVELGKQQLNEFKKRLQAVRLFKEGKNSPVSFSMSSVGFRQADGYTRPTFEVNVRVAKDKQDAFYAELSRSAKELGLERIDAYKLIPHYSENYLGKPDTEMGVTSHPHIVGFLKKALPVSQVDSIRTAQRESGLPEVTISDNGRRLDIPFIGEYSKQNYERYIQQTNNFREVLDGRGISGTYKQGGAKTRTLTNNPTDRGTTFGEYQAAFYRKNPELYSKRLINSAVVDRLRYETSITKGELVAMLDELPVTDLEKQFYDVLLKGKPDTTKVSVKDLYKKIESRSLQTGVRYLKKDGFSYAEYGYNGPYRTLSPETSRKQSDMYALFVDAKSIADEENRLASHGGAAGHPVVGHVRVSPIKGRPVIKGGRVVKYVDTKTKSTHTSLEWQNDPFQEPRNARAGDEGNWGKTKGFVESKDPENERRRLTERLENRKSDLERNKKELKQLHVDRDQFVAGTNVDALPMTPVSRAIYDAKKILAKIDELGATMGFRTDSNPLGAKIISINPSGDNKYEVILGYRTEANEPLQTHTFEYETQWPVTETGGGNGMTLRDLNVRGDRSFETAIEVTSSRNTDELPTPEQYERKIAEKAAGIQRVKNDIVEMTAKLASLPEGVDLAARQYLDLKEGQKYFYRVFRETLPYMYKKLKATHFTLPTLSTVAKTEWGSFRGVEWDNLSTKRSSLLGDKLEAKKPPYRYWVGGKEGTFGSDVPHRPQVTEKVEMMDDYLRSDADKVGYVIRSNDNGFLYLNREGVKLKTEKLGLVKARQLMYSRYQDALIEKMNIWRRNATDLSHIPELNKDTLLSVGDIRDLAKKMYYHDVVGSNKFSENVIKSMGMNPYGFRWNSELQRSVYVDEVPKQSLQQLLYQAYNTTRRRYGSFTDTTKISGRDQFDYGIMSLPWNKDDQRGVSIYKDGYLYTYTWNSTPSIRSLANPNHYQNEKSIDNTTYGEYDTFDNMTPEQLNATGDSHAGVLISYIMTQPKARAMLEQATGNKFERIIDEGGNSQYLIELNEGVMDLQKITFEE